MDVLTCAARINRNLKSLSTADQKTVIDFVQAGASGAKKIVGQKDGTDRSADAVEAAVTQ